MNEVTTRIHPQPGISGFKSLSPSAFVFVVKVGRGFRAVTEGSEGLGAGNAPLEPARPALPPQHHSQSHQSHLKGTIRISKQVQSQKKDKEVFKLAIRPKEQKDY